MGELVRAWNAGGAADVRGVVKDAVGDRGVDGGVEGGVVVGRGPLWMVSRLSDLPPCHDQDGGVVVGEPPRLVGCGAHDLFAVAAWVNAIVETGAGGVAIVDDDAALARFFASSRVKKGDVVWSGGGVIVEGVDKDVFDVVVVDAGRFSLALSAPDPTTLVRAAGRAVALAPPPRFTAVVDERERLVHPGFFRDDAADYAKDDRRAWVVDRCVLAAFAADGAVVDCVALPGRDVEEVVDDVVRAIDDAAVKAQTTNAAAASSTSLSLPLAQALSARVQRELPRVVVAPALDVGVAASVCARARAVGHPCIAAVPLRLHAVARTRRGHADEAANASDVVRGAAFVADVVAAGVVK